MPDVINRTWKRSLPSAGRSSRNALHCASAPFGIGSGPLTIAGGAGAATAATGAAAGGCDGEALRCPRSTKPTAAASPTPTTIVATRRR